MKPTGSLQARNTPRAIGIPLLTHVFLVEDAIKRQMVSDVPVCTFLSGGIDSSIVTAIAANYMNTRGKTLNTFSFDFKDNDRYFKANAFQPERDLPYVNRMLEEYETAHSYLECDENSLFKALFAAVDAKDMPGMTDVDSSLFIFLQPRQPKKQGSSYR